MQQFILHIIEQYGYFGVFFLILIENVFPPIPSEVILLFSGFFSTYTNLSVLYMIVASTFGSLLGAIILYYIGKIFNKERLKKIVNGKLGKILFLKEKDIDKADEWFDNKGNKSVFFCRFVPIVRSLISIPAGMSEMPMVKFIIYTVNNGIFSTGNYCLVSLVHSVKIAECNRRFLIRHNSVFIYYIQTVCLRQIFQFQKDFSSQSLPSTHFEIHKKLLFMSYNR